MPISAVGIPDHSVAERTAPRRPGSCRWSRAQGGRDDNSTPVRSARNSSVQRPVNATGWSSRKNVRPHRRPAPPVAFVYLTPNLHSHTGIAIDDPNDDDITAIPFSLFGRTYNSTLWSNLIWDMNKAYRIAFEATYRKTEYKEPTNLPNEGLGFQTQFAWFF